MVQLRMVNQPKERYNGQMRNSLSVFLKGWFVVCLLFHFAVWGQLFSSSWIFGVATVLGAITVAGNYFALCQNGEFRTRQSFKRLLQRMGPWHLPYLGLCAYVIFRLGQLLMVAPLRGQASTPAGDLAATIFITSSIMTIAASSLGLLRSPSRG